MEKSIRHYETGVSIAKFGGTPATASPWIWLGWSVARNFDGLSRVIAEAINRKESLRGEVAR